MVINKAKIKVEGKPQPIKVLFNPNEYVVERGVKYSEHAVPGLDSPIMQFINGEADTLRLSLFFDTYSTGIESQNALLPVSKKMPELAKADVRKYTQQIYALMEVNGHLHRPPKCEFIWGSLSFTGYVISVSQKFTMFNSLGIPVRATLDVTFKASETVDHQLRGEPRNSPDRTKSRMIHQGDSLWSLAHSEYDDASMWRVIADANNIENPRRLKSGTNVKLPAITK